MLISLLILIIVYPLVQYLEGSGWMLEVALVAVLVFGGGLFRFNSRYRLSIDDRLPIFIDGEVTLGLEDTTFNPFIYGQWHFAERHGVGFHWIEPPDPLIGFWSCSNDDRVILA